MIIIIIINIMNKLSHTCNNTQTKVNGYAYSVTHATLKRKEGWKSQSREKKGNLGKTTRFICRLMHKHQSTHLHTHIHIQLPEYTEIYFRIIIIWKTVVFEYMN